MIYLLHDMQKMTPHDQLSQLIDSYKDDELSIEDLDFVYAGVKPNYERFLKYMKNMKE